MRKVEIRPFRCARMAGPLVRRRRQRGAAMVEGALIITPALILMYGILELSLALVVAASLHHSGGLASDIARTAPMREDETTRTLAYVHERTEILPFMNQCLTVRAWEFVDLADVGIDYRDGELFNYQDATEQALLNDAALDYLGGLPILFHEDRATADKLGAEGRPIALIEVTCRWQYLSGLMSSLLGDSLTVFARTLVYYERPESG